MTTRPAGADVAVDPHPAPLADTRRPDRSWWVESCGVRLRAYQWGDDAAPPLLLAHGGFDFAGTMDGFAPLLADAGWRVVSWDQRGHGDSEHATLFNWEADVRDGFTVIESVTDDPVPFVGHSKGGGILMALAEARPDRVSAMVNLDGLPSERTVPDVSDRERRRLMAAELAQRLDFRRRAHEATRRPGTLTDLAARRRKMNPRLSTEWLEYLVPIGAEAVPPGHPDRSDLDRNDDIDPAETLWRWKLDPSMRFGGFGPYRPEWGLARMPGFRMPFLAVLGLEEDAMSWGTTPADVQPWLPRSCRFEPLEGVGHFVHIERPRHVADLVLEFLG